MAATRQRRRARNARRASPRAAYAAARRRPPPPAAHAAAAAAPLRRFRGLFWKFARVGERLSPWVALACLGMAFSILFQ